MIKEYTNVFKQSFTKDVVSNWQHLFCGTIIRSRSLPSFPVKTFSKRPNVENIIPEQSRDIKHNTLTQLHTIWYNILIKGTEDN